MLTTLSQVTEKVARMKVDTFHFCCLQTGQIMTKDALDLIFDWLVCLGLPTLREVANKLWKAFLNNQRICEEIFAVERKGAYNQIMIVKPLTKRSVSFDRLGKLRIEMGTTTVGAVAILNVTEAWKKLEFFNHGIHEPTQPIYCPLGPGVKQDNIVRVCEELVDCYKKGTCITNQHGHVFYVDHINRFVMNTYVENRKRQLDDALDFKKTLSKRQCLEKK